MLWADSSAADILEHIRDTAEMAKQATRVNQSSDRVIGRAEMQYYLKEPAFIPALPNPAQVLRNLEMKDRINKRLRFNFYRNK